MTAKRSMATSVTVVFGVASLVIILAVGFFSYRSIENLLEALNAFGHTQHLLELIQSVEVGLAGVQNADLPSAGPAAELPSRRQAAMKEVYARMDTLRAATSDNPGQLGRIEAVQALVTAHFARPDNDRPEMARILATLQAMRSAEFALFESRQRVAESRAQRTTSVILLGGLSTLLLISASFWIMATSRTRRLKAEQAGQEASALLRDVIEGSGDAIFVKDREGRFVMVNSACAAILGHAPADLLGRNLSAVLPADIARTIMQNDQVLIDSGQANTLEEELRVDGTIRTMLATKRPRRDASGKIIGLFGISKDISDRKRMESELVRANQQLSGWVDTLETRTREATLLTGMSDLLQACHAPKEAYSVAADSAERLFPGAQGSLVILKHSGNFLEVVVDWAGDADSERVFFPDDCWALRRGKPHFHGGDSSGSRCRHLGIAMDSGITLCVPMMAQGETLGLLCLRAPAGHSLREDANRRLAVTFADSLALSLANLRLREALREQAIRDPLTGLYNRRYMEESLERELLRVGRREKPLGIVLIDIDHFKRFNDTFGHDAGDTVLRTLGTFLKERSRGEDILCRFGGEEFLLILPEASLEVSTARAEDLRRQVKHLNVQHRKEPLGPISLSIGIACFPGHGANVDTLFRAADAALYRAKNQGRDRVEIASAATA